jgi:hypothetical protein
MLLSPFMMDIINILNVCPSSSLTLTNLLPFCPNDNSYTETVCSPASFLIQLNPGYSCLRRLSNEAHFREATFSNEADFTGASFPSNKGRIIFCHIIFEQPNKVTFSKSNLSKVSFHGSDITRIKFGDKISWGGRDGRDEFTIIEEECLKEQAKGERKGEKRKTEEQVSLEDVLSVYRNLRENYEFRLRYDDAGKFWN